jgi:hypothetical protein
MIDVIDWILLFLGMWGRCLRRKALKNISYIWSSKNVSIIAQAMTSNTHHRHQSRPHFVDPHIVARTPKAMNYDLGWRGDVEGLTGPRPDGGQVSEWDVHDRWVGARAARIQVEPGGHFLGWGRQHVQVAERSRIVKTAYFWVAHRRFRSLPSAKEKHRSAQ